MLKLKIKGSTGVKNFEFDNDDTIINLRQKILENDLTIDENGNRSNSYQLLAGYPPLQIVSPLDSKLNVSFRNNEVINIKMIKETLHPTPPLPPPSIIPIDQLQRIQTKSNTNVLIRPHSIDEETWNCLPDDIKIEISNNDIYQQNFQEDNEDWKNEYSDDEEDDNDEEEMNDNVLGNIHKNSNENSEIQQLIQLKELLRIHQNDQSLLNTRPTNPNSNQGLMGIPYPPITTHCPNQNNSNIPIKAVNNNNKREFGARVTGVHSTGSETIKSKSFGGGGIGKANNNNSNGGGFGARVSGFNNNVNGNSDDDEDN